MNRMRVGAGNLPVPAVHTPLVVRPSVGSKPRPPPTLREFLQARGGIFAVVHRGSSKSRVHLVWHLNWDQGFFFYPGGGEVVGAADLTPPLPMGVGVGGWPEWSPTDSALPGGGGDQILWVNI